MINKCIKEKKCRFEYYNSIFKDTKQSFSILKSVVFLRKESENDFKN